MAQKGGVGKTTTVVNLAGALARRGHSVVLIDLDPHGSCSSYFGFKPNSDDRNVHELFAAAVKKEVCAIGDLPRPTSTPRLSIISSATALVSLERRCGTVTGMGRVLSRHLPQLARRYEYCLIDCPPTLGLLVINALAAAELLIIPMQTEALALNSLDHLLRTLEMLTNSTGRTLPSIVVPTLFDRRTRAGCDSLLALRSRDDINLWSETIPIDTQLREASRLGVPLTGWQPQARAALAYERLLDRILEISSTELTVAS